MQYASTQTQRRTHTHIYTQRVSHKFATCDVYCKACITWMNMWLARTQPPLKHRLPRARTWVRPRRLGLGALIRSAYTAYTFLIDEQTCMLGPTEDQDWFLSEWEIDDQWCLGCHASPHLSEEGEWAPGCPRGRACEMEAGRCGSPLFAQSAHLLQGQDGPRHDHDMTCMHGIHNNP